MLILPQTDQKTKEILPLVNLKLKETESHSPQTQSFMGLASNPNKNHQLDIIFNQCKK